MNFKIIVFSALASFFLISCGGDDDGGGGSSTKVAEISESNEEELAVAATSAAKSAIDDSSAPQIGFRPASRDEVATVIDLTAQLCSSGSASGNFDDSGNGTFTYSNCGFSGAVVNGKVKITSKSTSSTTTTNISYENFTVTANGESQSFDFSMVCTTNTSTFDSSCVTSSSSLGFDNRTYTVSGSTVTGNSSSGYTVSASVSDPDHGSFSIETTSPVLFNCATTGLPSTGSISFSDNSGNTATVTYDSCTSFTVTNNGVSNSYTW